MADYREQKRGNLMIAGIVQRIKAYAEIKYPTAGAF